MVKISKRFLAPFALLLAVLAGCPEAPPNPADDPTSETVIRGRAPLNAGGKIRISASRGFEDDRIQEGEINEAGQFTVHMRGAFGRVTVEASGGSYLEPATTTVVRHAGKTLHAAVAEVEQYAQVEVAVTPWTDIAFARAGLDGYAESLEALNDTLGCQLASYSKLLSTPPAVPTEDKPVQSLSADALAYLYLGAFSQLAADLSDQFQLQPGARLTSMSLAKLLAADFSDGRIDGRQHGIRLLIVDGHPLPDNLLRQPLAQALRRFLAGPKNETSLRQTSALDLLQCVSRGADLQFGPVGQPLDIEAPTITFVAPQAGSYLAAAQDLACEASDISGVKTLQATIWQHDELLASALGQPSAVALSETAGVRLTAPLRLETLETGAARFQCEAVDAWGNTHIESRDFHVNRGGKSPELVLSASNSDEVAEVVQVRCICDDDPYSYRCELLDPPDGETPPTQLQVGDRWTSYNWDTRRLLDGFHTLTCGNWSHGIENPVTRDLTTRVRNSEKGIVTGAVYLESLIEHVSVTAYAYKNAEVGAQIGTAEAADGVFSIQLTNEYRGPVLLVAEKSTNPDISQPQARFKNIILGVSTPLGNGEVRLLIEHYEPGQRFVGRSMNFATTMAEALASSIWKQRIGSHSTFADAIRFSHRLVGQYLSPTRPFDVRETRVADLAKPAWQTGAADDEILLGLFHVGLSRLAVEYSINHCQRRQCITVSEIMAAMRSDLSDGRLDGRDLRGARPSLGHDAYLSEDFFRIELARAIRRWLDKVPFMDDHHEGVNVSGLLPRDFSGHDQFLDNISGHDSQIFGHRPGATYDEDGPVLSVHVVNAEGRPMDLSNAIGTTRFRIVVDGVDDSGVAWVRASIGDNPLENSQPVRAEHAEYWVDTSNLPDGESHVLIEAQDGAGNYSTPERVVFVVNKVNPIVELENSEVWIRDGYYHLTGSVSKSPVTVQLFDGLSALGDAWDIPNGEHSFSVDTKLACSASHILTVRVQDLSGNVGEGHQVVHCDEHAPTISTRSRNFIQESRFAALYDESGSVLQYERRGDAASVTWPARFEKFFTRLDLLPERGLTVEAQNLPVLAFSVSDRGTKNFGTDDDAIVVEYQYLVGGDIKRPWSRLPFPGRGRDYEIPISYQTLSRELASPNPELEHQIVVRAMDLAGNVEAEVYSFSMNILSPPLWVGACQISPELAFHTLRDLTLHKIFKRSSVELRQNKVKYVTNLPAESLAPSGDALVRFSQPTIRLRITKVAKGKYVGKQEGVDKHMLDPASGLCGTGSHWLLYNSQDEVNKALTPPYAPKCNQGKHPDNGFVFAPLAYMPTKVPSEIRVDSRTDDESGDAGDGYHVRPGLTATVSWSALKPQLLVERAPFERVLYDWNREIAVEMPFDGGPRTERYWLHQYDQYGVDIWHDIYRWGTPGVPNPFLQRFKTLAYIGGFIVDSESAMSVQARHEDLGLAIPVQYAGSCGSKFSYDVP
jgi:hypothetical protein